MTREEKRTVLAVFGELVKKDYNELNTFLGSVTIREMTRMYDRLKYEDWCDEHGISYEGMTDDDRIQAWMDVNGYR